MLRRLLPPLFFLLLSVLISAGDGFAQRPQNLDKLRKREIADVRFEGNESISSAELQSIITARATGGLELFLNNIYSGFGTPRQYVDETALGNDTLYIYAYYRFRGYFDTKVKYTLHESKESADAWKKVDEQNRLRLRGKQEPYPLVEDTVIFTVSEGKPYKVAGFTFEGFEHLPLELENNITENISIKLNTQYSRGAIAAEALRVSEILGENGYPFLSQPRDSSIVERDTIRKTVTISLKFITGPRIRNGATHIMYDTAFSAKGHVRDKVVRRQISLDSGAWYKTSDHRASERDLYRLGAFQSLHVDLDTTALSKTPDSARDGLTLPIVVHLSMRPAASLLVGPYGGGGVSGFIFGLSLGYSNPNFFNGSENFTSQAAYQFFPTSQHHGSLGGEFTFPYIGLKNVPLIFNGSFTYAEEINKYLERIINAGMGLNFVLTNNPELKSTFAPKLSLEYVSRLYIDSSIFDRRLDSQNIRPQFNSFVSGDFIEDWTNDLIYPSRGSKFSVSSQIALPFVAQIIPTNLPSAAYIKNTAQFKSYFDLSKTQGASILEYRILGGWVYLFNPNDDSRDITVENRYYGGGTSSLRGWPAKSLLVSSNNAPGSPLFGGYKTVETNLEWRIAPFRYPLAFTAVQQFLSSVRVAFFCDAGNVWDKTASIALNNVAIAIGTGLRYNTPVGPLRIDFGFKFFDPYPPATADKNLPLAIPTNSTGVWIFNRKPFNFNDIFNIQFALGEAF